MFANKQYGVIAWTKHSVVSDQLKPADLDLHCFQKRAYILEKIYVSFLYLFSTVLLLGFGAQLIGPI